MSKLLRARLQAARTAADNAPRAVALTCDDCQAQLYTDTCSLEFLNTWLREHIGHDMRPTFVQDRRV